jgi:hypothetical protein
MPRKKKHAESARDWRPTDEQAQLVAELVCEQYLGVRQIAGWLFSGLKPSSGIHRVERLLEWASRQGILRVDGMRDPNREAGLKCRFPGIEFIVARDDLGEGASTASDANTMVRVAASAVCRQAARNVVHRIRKLAGSGSGSNERIVIANGGGASIARTVSHIASYLHDDERRFGESLHSISLNSASIPDRFDFSANFLATRIAESYGARHIAAGEHIWSEELKRIYTDDLGIINLLLCGIGTRNGLLFQWLQQNRQVNLPEEAVGDVCLIPVFSEPTTSQETLTDGGYSTSLGINPSRVIMKRLASEGKVVIVIVDAPPVPSGVAPVHQTEKDGDPALQGRPSNLQKVKIAIEVMRQKYASTCVLGSSLAREIISQVPY